MGRYDEASDSSVHWLVTIINIPGLDQFKTIEDCYKNIPKNIAYLHMRFKTNLMPL